MGNREVTFVNLKAFLQNGVPVIFDCDATLNNILEYTNRESHYGDPDFFLSLKPYKHVMSVIYDLISYCGTDNLWICTASYNPQVMQAKVKWFDKYIPELPKSHIIQQYEWESKPDKMSNYITRPGVLIDDYTRQCEEWKRKGGYAIKALNPYNHLGGKWKGEVFRVCPGEAEVHSEWTPNSRDLVI